MKLMTINTHSLIEENYTEKLASFTEYIMSELPDVIAMQEVNQPADAEEISAKKLLGYAPLSESIPIPVKAGNHAFSTVKALAEQGAEYSWTYLPIKNGYDIFDEGLALLSRTPILETDVCTVSGTDDYSNWKTRKALGIYACGQWFYSVHFGWWDDSDDRFEEQWKRLSSHISGKSPVWLMGDFNSPCEIRNEGYDLVKNSGWYDSFELAEHKTGRVTVDKAIAGWESKGCISGGMRLDYIFSDSVRGIKSCKTVFDGKNQPVVSDHFGVEIEVKGDC